VFFENVKVPAESILGEIGKGHLIAFNVLNMGRFKLGNMSLGGCKRLIDISVQYANERHQFGQPISSFGAIKYKIAEQTIRTFALESAVYRVSEMMKDKKDALLEDGLSFAEALLQSAEEFAIECSFIKVYGSEVLNYVVDEGVQIYGGNGFSEEYPLASAYRDARINRIYEGTNEINRLLVVNMLLKRALSGKLEMTDAAWKVQKELTKLPSFQTDHTPLSKERTAVENMKKLCLLVAGAAVKYQMDGKLDLKNEQMIVTNVSDMLMQTFMCESALLRVLKLKDMNDSSPAFECKKQILEALLYDSHDMLRKWSKDALNSFASGDEKRVMLMGVQRFANYNDVDINHLRKEIANFQIKENSLS
jgi:hypothetical protein